MSLWTAEIEYAGKLISAAVDGIASARREFEGPLFEPSPVEAIWTPAIVCASIGMMGGRLTQNRNGTSRVAFGGLVGSLVGSGLALAWTSRRFARKATGKAVKSVNAVRDQHWLQANPIDYA